MEKEMETIITAHIEDIFRKRIIDALSFFKNYNIDVININFDYSDSPYKCVIKTRDKK